MERAKRVAHVQVSGDTAPYVQPVECYRGKEGMAITIAEGC